MSTYSLNDAANILKVSPARLRYWKRTTLAQAHVAVRARRPDPVTLGDGTQSAFDFRDLVCVRAMLTLVDRGISVRRIRTAVEVLQENLPDLDDPLAALRLWSDGSARIVVQHEGVLIEPEGQMVLDFGEGNETPADPASIEDRPVHPLELQAEVMRLFEIGCRLDADPATYEEATAAYRQCVELDPSFADAQCNLGAVLYNAGKPEPARRCFERCLEIDPRHVEAHFNVANLLEEAGCDEMAMSHYRAALRSDPFYAELHVNMALLHERMSGAESGRDHWRRYLQLDPTGAWSEVARQRLVVSPAQGPAR